MVGSTIVMAVIVILIPFALLVCLSTPLIKPSNWLQVSVIDINIGWTDIQHAARPKSSLGSAADKYQD